ncbi:helix-turn-helix domain-containing protein [Pelotomaculum propionicicum]|uniref:helix-turn-helix domain-containing protein n=1 Tax=Pelotomaculum propionicicum TaxID=258475 RepID=UPI003B77734C
MDKSLPTLFGKRIRLLRESLGYTQAKIGDAIGKTNFAINRIEMGNRGSMARTETIQQFVELLGVPLDWLMSEEDNLDSEETKTIVQGAGIRANIYMALLSAGINRRTLPTLAADLQKLIETIRDSQAV